MINRLIPKKTRVLIRHSFHSIHRLFGRLRFSGSRIIYTCYQSKNFNFIVNFFPKIIVSLEIIPRFIYNIKIHIFPRGGSLEIWVNTRFQGFKTSKDTGDYRISSIKFTDLFRTKYWTLRSFHESSVFFPENFCKFYRTLFCNRLYPRLLNSSIKFKELFFQCDIEQISGVINPSYFPAVFNKCFSDLRKVIVELQNASEHWRRRDSRMIFVPLDGEVA